ncbi:MAG: hypothetical protein IID40_01130, partial [Planctomycetes bacterium]|nr:hypothetical protein [Planctomycetota bacterium]
MSILCWLSILLLWRRGIDQVDAQSGATKDGSEKEKWEAPWTIAASVMVAYAGFGAPPGHLMAASLMSAPAAIVIAKLLVPETATPQTAGDARIEIPVESHNIFDAAARGAT